ncbi:siroheme synthase CysG [Sphingomonas sp. ASV193]|uniref:siroheme synthase CysG n=1 Tax=Sphingomonas sp. ASV193 TaxID=3144405 RepID=UPI0032E8EB88
MSGTGRIGALSNLPLFHDLRGRKAVVVGASLAADWKAELLGAAGARVLRIAAGWTPVDLDGAAIALADLSDRDEAARFVAAARGAGALANVIDWPEFCDVQFGTIVNRSPVVIGISTDGAAPMLGQSIRTRIEAVLPTGIADWARAAKSWRARLKGRIGDFEARRAFWRRFVATAWREHRRSPDDADFDTLIAESPEVEGAIKGKVMLVGSGPGDPELLTLKAVRALQDATVILHDQLVGPGVLELARREARRIAVGKSPRGPSTSQADINRLIVELALAGETVVRLKGGDPMIFGRATEEIEACRAAGVEVTIVPGISAAQGAAAALGLSLTERKHARRVQFVTGHGADGRLPADIDWASIADRRATTILYMPRATLDQFVRKALASGLDPATPAAAIASVSLPAETHGWSAVADIGAVAAGLPAGAPVTIVIGWIGRSRVERAGDVVALPLALAS